MPTRYAIALVFDVPVELGQCIGTAAFRPTLRTALVTIRAIAWLKPNPYLRDLAKHLLSMCVAAGVCWGHAPPGHRLLDRLKLPQVRRGRGGDCAAVAPVPGDRQVGALRTEDGAHTPRADQHSAPPPRGMRGQCYVSLSQCCHTGYATTSTILELCA